MSLVQLNTRGATRLVILTRRWAIKVPRVVRASDGKLRVMIRNLPS